ncbi:Rad9-domain-containing protein [Collybia nuda]|uniref:Rad9-domain-containing protein n=1 Tax=Collybia nuda TaxID=64659 RepID=A0A9P5YBR7_9AGAR|nr:Rad9-domain-containing protein [Collybia nuda]
MQVTLDSFALKSFTKSLNCLSRYGEELTIYATPETFSLSATNLSKSAYCRFKYEKQFFSKYVLNEQKSTGTEWGLDEAISVTGQMLIKPLLSILKHRTVEKTVEKCEMSIIEGNLRMEDGSPVEDNLVVRLYCKHGVVKTHRLLLLTPTSLMAPGVPDAYNESNLTIGPKAVKDMIEHFPLARGVKSDPQLIWSFGESEVELRSLESSIDSKGKAQLITELTISAEEFDVYNVYASPTTIAFHLREFNATIAFAESMSLSLNIRFTDPSAPLFIDVEGDSLEALFVISTSQVHGAVTGAPSQYYQPLANKKRERDETPVDQNRVKKPTKVAQRINKLESLPQSTQVVRPTPVVQRTESDMTMPPPSFIPPAILPHNPFQEPLFWPSSSQLSAANGVAFQGTGLGLEYMDADELANMLEGEGEEVAYDFSAMVVLPVNPHRSYVRRANFRVLSKSEPTCTTT